MSDAELIRRFVDGRDQVAFRELYRRHTPPVYGLLCRLTSGREIDAADLMLDAWIRAARKLSAFRGESQFRTWLTGIALNCYRESRRDAATAGAQQLSDAAADFDALEARVEHRSADIEQVLWALPAHYREVLVLHDVDGYTHEDIGKALGIEPGTSKSRLSRARRLFRVWWRQSAPLPHEDAL